MQRYIVTHASPDLDAITSVWLIKRYFPGWEGAGVLFVPAGEKLQGTYEEEGKVIEKVDGKEVIHVDTGLGPLDHHQNGDEYICAASKTFDFIVNLPRSIFSQNETKKEAVERMIDVAVAIDHFQEVFYPDSLASHHEFSLVAIIDGLRLEYPGENIRYVEMGCICLDAILHTFENRIWAERQIKDIGIEFDTKWGKGIAVETVNDSILKLSQKMGYVIAVRKDPQHEAVRIKARPRQRRKLETRNSKLETNDPQSNINDIDLTPVYHQLKKMDPDATWYLHGSKRMLLNGSSKNPNMSGTTLSLDEVIEVLKETK